MTTQEAQSEQIAAQLLMGLTFGWLASRAIYVAAELGIADLLRDGPKTTDELARISDAHGPSLYRLLRTLGGYGIFEEDDAGRFKLTPRALCFKPGP